MNTIRFSFAKIATVALCVALLPCWGAFAEEAEAHTCGDFAYVVQEDGTAKITGYTGGASSLAVPETLDGYAVTDIGDQAFYECANLTEITLPGSLTIIGDRAFASCENLTEITLPDSLTIIGDWAFASCENLTEITLPDSLTIIGDRAFYDCGNLTEITLPDGLTAIGYGAFSYCANLTEITLPDSLESIRGNPFAGSGIQSIHVSPNHPLFAMIGGVLFSKPDKRLICYPPARTDTAYAVPEGTLTIDYSAFYDCDNLTEITLPESLTRIGFSAFTSCLFTEITLPDSLTVIEDFAFSACDNLTEITLPDSVTTVGYWAFIGCDNLTEITLPDSVTTIGDEAFDECKNLSSIIVGRDSYAMEYCIANNLPYSYADEQPSDEFAYVVQADGTATITGYTGDAWKLIVPEVLDGHPVTAIGDAAFSGCDHLTKIELPDSLTAIGVGAFFRCENLMKITLPDSLTAIGNLAFSRCDNLSSIIVGQDSYAMEYCIENDLPYSVRKK